MRIFFFSSLCFSARSFFFEFLRPSQEVLQPRTRQSSLFCQNIFADSVPSLYCEQSNNFFTFSIPNGNLLSATKNKIQSNNGFFTCFYGNNCRNDAGFFPLLPSTPGFFFYAMLLTGNLVPSEDIFPGRAPRDNWRLAVTTKLTFLAPFFFSHNPSSLPWFFFSHIQWHSKIAQPAKFSPCPSL